MTRYNIYHGNDFLMLVEAENEGDAILKALEAIELEAVPVVESKEDWQ